MFGLVCLQVLCGLEGRVTLLTLVRAVHTLLLLLPLKSRIARIEGSCVYPSLTRVATSRPSANCPCGGWRVVLGGRRRWLLRWWWLGFLWCVVRGELTFDRPGVDDWLRRVWHKGTFF